MPIQRKSIVRILVVVVLILLIPLVMTIHDGAVEGVGWNWTPGDFLAMGALLFLFGLAIDFAVRKITRPAYRFITVAGILIAFLAVWTELAVGAVSQLVTFLFGVAT